MLRYARGNPVLVVIVLGAVLSIGSFAWFYSRGMTNVYGDGIAHLNIARKVVDSPDASLWQRYVQIGTPWLPLQTFLLLPLVTDDWMWRTGVGGSILSMVSFVVAAVLLFLLAQRLYSSEDGRWRRALPAISAGIFLLNPSALYLQSTPMSEPVFMAALIAAVYALQRWVEGQTLGSLVLAGAVTAIAMLSRYEAWPVAAFAAPLVGLASRGGLSVRLRNATLFAAVAALGPIYWLWHNWAIYGSAIEFVTGPYSARGIYLDNLSSLGWSSFLVGRAGLDLVLMLTAVAVCAGPLVLLLGAGGILRLGVARRRELAHLAPSVLLLIPFLFHVFSLYRGEIQIFPLSAFGLLNVRYGLPHLLAVALFAPAAIPLCARVFRRAAVAVFCGLALVQYGYLISEGPSLLAICQEGLRNGVNARPARERARIAAFLKQEAPPPVVLMHTGALGSVVPPAGLSFRDIIHEGAIRWHRLDEGIPVDVSTVVVREDDPLDRRLKETPGLARQLAEEFAHAYSSGEIHVYRRGREQPNR